MTRVVVRGGTAANPSSSAQAAARASTGTTASAVAAAPAPPPPPAGATATPVAAIAKEENLEAVTEAASELQPQASEAPALHPNREERREGKSEDASETPPVAALSGFQDSAKASGVDAGRAAVLLPSTSSSGLGNFRRGSWSATVRRLPISSSSRSHEDGDGYNSADESRPWVAPEPSGFEEEEEREGHFETELRRVRGLEVRKMAADGNCLFRAVADQVYGDPEMFEDTRQMCIDYMEKERDHFSQFVTESFSAYCKRKRRDKVYGNNLEIQAMAEMYNRPIHIYSYTTDPINIFHGQYETDLPPIRLSYHRGNHYNSLYDPTRSSVGAGLGFGSLRGRNVDRDQVKAAILAQQDQQIDNALVAEGRYYSDLELTEQEIERMVMEASRMEYLAQERRRQMEASAGGEPSSSGATSRSSGAGAASGGGGSQQQQQQLGQAVSCNSETLAMDAAANRNSNVRMLLSMGFSYVRVMEASSAFGDDVNNMLCYLLETNSLGVGESMYRMKGKAAEK